MDKSERQLQVLATFVHGVLASFHGLGLIYNLRRKNYKDTAVHFVVLTYDALCTYSHYKTIKKKNTAEPDETRTKQSINNK